MDRRAKQLISKSPVRRMLGLYRDRPASLSSIIHSLSRLVPLRNYTILAYYQRERRVSQCNLVGNDSRWVARSTKTKMTKLSAQDKLNIVLRLIAGESTAEELSKQNGVRSAKTIYNWRKRLVASADVIFAEKRGIRPRDSSKLPPLDHAADLADVPQDAVDSVPVSEDEADRELQDLFGVDLRARRRRAKKRLIRRGRSKRGRMNLKRSIGLNLQRAKDSSAKI